MASSQDQEEHISNSKKRRREDDGSSSTCSESDRKNDKNVINPALVHEEEASVAAGAGNPLTVNSCSIAQGSAPPKSEGNETNPPAQKVAPEAADKDPITPAARRPNRAKKRRQVTVRPWRIRSVCSHSPRSQPLQPHPPCKFKFGRLKKIIEADSPVAEEVDNP